MKRLALLIILAVAACSPKPADHDVSASSAEVSQASSSSVSVSPTATTQATIPANFVGIWDASVKACKDTSIMKLTVTPVDMDFWETTARVTSVTVTSPNDITVQADSSGEGEEWKDTLHMVLSDGGNTLTIDESKTGVRVRCAAT